MGSLRALALVMGSAMLAGFDPLLGTRLRGVKV